MERLGPKRTSVRDMEISLLLSFLRQSIEGTISFFFSAGSSCFWHVSPGVSRHLAVSRCNSAQAYIPTQMIASRHLHCVAVIVDDLRPLARLIVYSLGLLSKYDHVRRSVLGRLLPGEADPQDWIPYATG